MQQFYLFRKYRTFKKTDQGVSTFWTPDMFNHSLVIQKMPTMDVASSSPRYRRILADVPSPPHSHRHVFAATSPTMCPSHRHRPGFADW
jgi:hypothetical protein